MRNIIYLLIITVFTSCDISNSSDNGKIEIYQLKQRIASSNGESINNYPEQLQLLKEKYDGTSFKIDTSIIRVDKHSKKILFADEFSASKTDLNSTPFIKSSEIIGINFQTNEIVFTKEGSDKIRNLTHNVKYSNQFVLTVDTVPVINGYFENGFTSQNVYGFKILYNPKTLIDEKTTENSIQKYYIEYLTKDHKYIKINLKEHISLHKACMNSNKVIK